MGTIITATWLAVVSYQPWTVEATYGLSSQHQEEGTTSSITIFSMPMHHWTCQKHIDEDGSDWTRRVDTKMRKWANENGLVVTMVTKRCKKVK